MRRAALALALAGALSGCVTEARASRVRGASGFLENVAEYEAPAQSRCARFSRGSRAGEACEEARYLAEVYVRKLSPGDDVCLEGGFGDPPAASCRARGMVADVATNRILLEVRQARPDSRWFQKESNQFWFQEGALVDLYLVDHGY